MLKSLEQHIRQQLLNRGIAEQFPLYNPILWTDNGHFGNQVFLHLNVVLSYQWHVQLISCWHVLCIDKVSAKWSAAVICVHILARLLRGIMWQPKMKVCLE